MTFPLGYNLIPVNPMKEVEERVAELYSAGYSRSRVKTPISFDQDICPSSFEVFDEILSKQVGTPKDNDFFSVYSMWDNLFTMLAHGSYILDTSHVVYFEALAYLKDDDYLSSLRGAGRPDALPPSAKVTSEMYDIVDRSNRSFFFAMQTPIDVSTLRLNEFGLLNEKTDALALYDLVKKENTRDGEMIRLLKVSVIDKRPLKKEMERLVRPL